jgi:hypothetical protein
MCYRDFLSRETEVRMSIDSQDAGVLRELAKQVRDIAAHPAQEERRTLWRKINRLESCRIPVLLCMHDLYWNEVVPEHRLETADPKAREYERQLRLQIWQWEYVDDDCVTEPIVEYSLDHRKPQLIAPEKTRPDIDTLGAYHVVPVIKKESDIEKVIIDTERYIDWDATDRNREWVQEVFDGILIPVRRPLWFGCAPFDYLCEIRGMDNVFLDMFERPEWLEEIMRRLYQLHIDNALFMERENALVLNNSYQLASNGGQGYTDELPAEGFEPDERVRLRDIWGHSTGQASVSISPEMHERFITQFDRLYHQLFGLTGVGCCETVDKKMHLYRTLPNLRRISISAWNDFARAAEEIGSDYVFALKPSAVSISQSNWDVDKDMQDLTDILEKSKGCHVEIIHREIATCQGKPERISQWSTAAKQLAEQHRI